MKKTKTKLTDKQFFKTQVDFLKTQYYQYLCDKNYSSNTIKHSTDKLARFFYYLIDETKMKSIKELSRQHILDYKEHIKSRSKSMQYILLAKVKLFCKFLVETQWLITNPYQNITYHEEQNIGIRGKESLWEEVTVKYHRRKFKNSLIKIKDEFLKYMEVLGFSKVTIRSRSGEINYFFYFLLTQTDLKSIKNIKKDTLRSYQVYIGTKAQSKGKLLTLNAKISRIKGVKKFCEFLAEYEYLEHNLSINLKYPKEPQTIPRGILTLSQMSKLLAQPDITTPLGLRDRVILEILYATGIRNQELRNLQLKHIDTDRGEILIYKGKGGRTRIVPTGEICATFIEDYLIKARPYLTKFNPLSDYLIVSKAGEQLSGHHLSARVKKYAKKAGIKEKITPHNIRHTMATHMLKSKASLRHIQAILGHSKLNSTQIYTRVEISDLRKIHQKCHPRGKKQS